MKVRKWNESDIDIIEELEKDCFTDSWSRTAILDAINSPSFFGYLLINDNDNVVGYFGFSFIYPEAYIANLAIKREYRCQGYGNVLIDEILKVAAEFGVKDLTLEVRESNEKAIKLYEKKGFKKEGLRKGFYSDGENAIIYWKRNIDNISESALKRKKVLV